MNIWKKIQEKEIHLWVVFSICTLVLAGLFVYSKYYSTNQYNLSITNSGNENQSLKYGTWPSLSNPNFYQSVKDEFIDKKANFVEVNLSTMKLRVYKNGQIIKEVTILSKGKKGSWWETPAGLYKAENKIPKHLSSFSPVYTEWNIPFQGNFFIHGWPYYAANNEPVKSSYSGGCIRLSDEDAKAVYDEVKVGMPILVYEETLSKADYTYEANVPNVSAENYIVGDLGSNFVFMKKDSTEPIPLQSISKLLTALVATDYMDIERVITGVKGSESDKTKRVIDGQKYSVYDLLFPLLLESSNDASASLSKELGNIRYVNLMNDKAKSIGMINTVIKDPYGTESGNITTSEDTFHLAQYLYNYRKFILDLSNNKVANASYGKSIFDSLTNQTTFKDNPNYLGGIKSTSPNGKEYLLSIFNISFSGQKTPVVFVVNNSNNAEEDTRIMLEHIKTAYKQNSI